MSPIERAAAVLGDLARRDVSLAPRTTYRVGGAAALAVEVASVDELTMVSQAVRAGPLPVVVVGNGSNLLVSDAGFAGVAVVLGEAFAGIEVEGTRVRAGGRAALPVVARRTVAVGLTGFEWAVGVPGTIGGAVRMNAGGHGADMAAALEGVRVFDLGTGQDVLVAPGALELSYRHSALEPQQVVVEATLALAHGHRERSSAELGEIVRWRREHQPGGANAGSVFANPTGDSAGRLIDAAGLKGLRVGGAEVSAKHANFIQASSDARAADVLGLMVEVADRVQAASGVRLRPETRLVGFAPEEIPSDWLAADPQLLIEG